MSLDVALQSVAFYVLSCSTCAKINHRRKARVQAKRERAEKQELERDQPGLYHHPSPFNTNPYWTEEIMMGPGPPKQKNGSKNASQRALNTAGQGSSYAGSTALSSDSPGSPTAGTESSQISGDGWNRKRYQREDEDLWGHDVPGPGQRIMDAIAKAGSSARTVLESRLNRGSGLYKEGDEPSRSYFQARNPPVNDLHPPVVSTAPSSRDETRWMLQPPPPAKVMEGKERVNRSRAVSTGSSRRGVEGTPLSRQVTERLVEAKLQRGETPSVFEARSLASRAETRARTPTSNWPRYQSQERSRSSSFDEDEPSTMKRRRSRRARISVTTSERSSFDSIDHIPLPSSVHLDSTHTEMSEQSNRPILAALLSSSATVHRGSKDGLQALEELNQPLSTNDMNLRMESPSQKTSPSANAIPTHILSADLEFTSASNYQLPETVSLNHSS